MGDGDLSCTGGCSCIGFWVLLATGGNVNSLYSPTPISSSALTVTGIFSSHLETDEMFDSTSDVLCLSGLLSPAERLPSPLLLSLLNGHTIHLHLFALENFPYCPLFLFYQWW